MGKNLSQLFFVIFASLGIVIYCGVAARFLSDKISKTKYDEAILVDKNTFSQRVIYISQAHTTRQRYVLAFNVSGVKKSFFVSADTYDSCHKGQKGTLEYKGSKFIDFS